MRRMTALIAGGLFGAGLVLSGMTDTARVQGFLDLSGAWDPTLAFVMGAAVLPMALAWAWAARRRVSLSGRAIPERPSPRLDGALIAGSAMFGAGWGLVGLCPGPALASAATGGLPVLVFLVAMAAGMLAAIPARRRGASLVRT